jgi:hypothetical protein
LHLTSAFAVREFPVAFQHLQAGRPAGSIVQALFAVCYAIKDMRAQPCRLAILFVLCCHLLSARLRTWYVILAMLPEP